MKENRAPATVLRDLVPLASLLNLSLDKSQR